MEFGIWVYPWDMIDEGIDSVIERVERMGIRHINLATNYHSVQTFNPHNPVRKTFFAGANAYFQPQQDLYGRLKPVANDQMGNEDWLMEIIDGVRSSSLKLNSWTVGCHNSVLGMENRDLTLQNPFGDPLVFGLCPSNPDVREYLAALLVDIDDRTEFDSIQLETFHYFHGTGWGWHHQKFRSDIGDLGEFLFGLCFCDDCRELAAQQDIDVVDAKQTAQRAIIDLADRRIDTNIPPKNWIAEHPPLNEYIKLRSDSIADLYSSLEATVSSDLGCYIGILGVENSWMHGYDFDRLSDHLDHYLVYAYESSENEAVRAYEDAVERVPPDIDVHAGLLPGHPIVDDRQTVIDQVLGLAEAGTDLISFYNYGLLSDTRLDWVNEAISATS